ncbi:MAG: hypothetical protein K2K69_03900 [Muribaculaceae bacterium]|nr:hypothetical protein [Muribaculaceae bacterium]
MDINKAQLASKLLAEMERVKDMKEYSEGHRNTIWQVAIDKELFRIPLGAKTIFVEAIDKALEYYKSEIEKL